MIASLMRNFRVSENAVQSAVATLHADVQRLWTIDAPDLRALHRGRVEGAVDALVTLGLMSAADATALRGAIGTAIEYATD